MINPDTIAVPARARETKQSFAPTCYMPNVQAGHGMPFPPFHLTSSKTLDPDCRQMFETRFVFCFPPRGSNFFGF